MESKNALISVFNKDGITNFADSLNKMGYTIFSSGGTAKHLADAGIAVIDIAKVTGFPAILGHRVVTLSPKVHGGILALDTPEHNADLEKYKIPRFGLVCCDLYPVQDAIAKFNATVDSVMEMTDIGGPTMIRAAAKNHKNVIVVCDPTDREQVISALKTNGDISIIDRRCLAQKVFALMKAYDGAIEKFLADYSA